MNNPKLFLVVLGGRVSNCNIELHDVRWSIAKNIKDAYPDLRKQWFGDPKGLHIDSYKEIEYVEGYKIVIIPREGNHNKRIDTNNGSNKTTNRNYLWFINIGGYSQNTMSELHEFGLFVASTYSDAVKKGKKVLLKQAKLRHKDDIKAVRFDKKLDNCIKVSPKRDWDILLTKDSEKREVALIPDWYGYKKIDTM